MGRLGKYRDTKEISEMFGLTKDTIQNLCHARGQKFAIRFAPKGKFWIDPDKFHIFIEERRRA